MAAPVTHLFFADKFYDKYGEIDRFQFFAGNCLPDIRYIDKKIPRTKFHSIDVSIDDVLREKSDFWKGVKFHSFIDEKRDYFYEKHGVYKPGISDGIFIYSLKVLEDDILYSQLSFRQDFIKFLSEYEFPIYDINLESITKWKNIISDYFSVQPYNKSRKDFILGVGFDENLSKQIESMLNELRLKYLQKINDMIIFVENNIK